ncbi:MAG: 23S rRNA (uracil(1939)-C(5))-methyltransferase RlmD [Tissierellia bacterium]|nr:23S rRNA (uracil(1939)-C(5))-methyltransferase RlmD [Tissierellia bacterium]
MEIGDIFTGEIIDLTEDGRGVIKERGQVIFTDKGVIGDFVSVYIKEKKKRFLVAETLDIIQKSDKRVESDCPVFGTCGGCDFRELDYSEEVELKKEFISKAFRKLAGLENFELKDFFEAKETNGYRNNIQLPVSFDGELKVGFYKKKSSEIVEFEECKLISKEANRLLKELKVFLTSKIDYNDLLKLKELVMRTNREGSYLLIFKTRKLTFKGNASLINYLESNKISAFEETLDGKKFIHLTGDKKLRENLLGMDFTYSPRAFFQVNTLQAEVLYKKALEMADLKKDDVILELYSGIGGISLLAADRVNRVIGIEIVSSATEDAKENARKNGIDNATFFTGDVKVIFENNFQEYKANKIIVDPPRNGVEKEVLEKIGKSKIESLVYVSCNPQTLARDVKYLMENGFKLEEVVGVDLFPRTGHTETVVLLSKGEVDSKKIRVEFSLEDMDMSEFQDGATYTQIKDYVLEHSGLKVSNLYISQIKRKCGIEVGKNYNLPKSEDSRQPMCPPEKEKAIREAFKYFGMI